MQDPVSLLSAIVDLAEAAGRVILPLYEARARAMTKADGTPVTEADVAAERLILAGLGRIAPTIPAVAEEMMADGGAPSVGDTFWLVDPLDGTKEFVARTGEFTVNIGLIAAGIPVLGVIHAPVTGETYAAAGGRATYAATGESHAIPIAARAMPATGAVATVSRRHGSGGAGAAFLAERGILARTTVGSSLKFGLIARGLADVYPRFGETSEWDTAAGHAILMAAGGRVDGLDGRPLAYGKPGFRNTGFIAWGADGRC
jgi:3'(2'), 5'-bisphosphate nucleotidase